jgi:uncharacterized surface protein with fasciclin (FAS1) repeats
MEGGNVALYGVAGQKATVTDSMEIDNGMVYVIDNVLLPTDVMTKVTITAEK